MRVCIVSYKFVDCKHGMQHRFMIPPVAAFWWRGPRYPVARFVVLYRRYRPRIMYNTFVLDRKHFFDIYYIESEESEVVESRVTRFERDGRDCLSGTRVVS